ncbi:MAG TPA: transporter substrate-binding domain-containing protein [Actinomycetota bacterium]|nr:transporter substrate-binding domain-containing protein [Actinomycetota bacterium]
MRRKRFWPMLALVAVLALVAAACGEDEGNGTTTGATGGETGTTTGAAPGGKVCDSVDANAGDLLARICSDGDIRVSTDPAYPPQSFLNEDTGDYEGFDIDVATEIANRLGVTVSWQAPSWDLIIAGGWNDRWDMSVGSMTVTPQRAEVLDFTPAYYYTPAVVAVHKDNTTITNLETDLDGKTIGVCGGCTYDYFLQKTLEIPGYTFDFIIDDANIVTYDTDSTAVQDLSLGDGTRLDAAISSETVIQGAIDKGKPIKMVGDPIFYEPLAVAFDKSSQLDDASLLQAVSDIVDEMHSDGTLSDMSMQWFKTDYTVTV